jgi:ATP-dependent protease ClpP protease subunit
MGGSGGNESDASNAQATLHAINLGLAMKIASRTRLTVDEIMQHIMHNEEMWFNSDKALKMGLVDKII